MPTINVEQAGNELQNELQAGIASCNTDGFHARLRQRLAQAWEEGRWSPPGATLNPYGAADDPMIATGTEGFPGLRLLALRSAAQAALAWIENMAPTVRRTALADQLRLALCGASAGAPAVELCQECHHQEMYRRVFDRWGSFDTAVVRAQVLMRASGEAELLIAADEIDRVRVGIGGQP